MLAVISFDSTKSIVNTIHDPSNLPSWLRGQIFVGKWGPTLVFFVCAKSRLGRNARPTSIKWQVDNAMSDEDYEDRRTDGPRWWDNFGGTVPGLCLVAVSNPPEDLVGGWLGSSRVSQMLSRLFRQQNLPLSIT